MRARRRSQALLVAAAVALALAGTASAKLPPLPRGWPATLQLGLTESPGTHAPVKLGFRYQYLAGGVNTGSGWSTWNPNGSFASQYVRDSWARGEIPVLTYYMLLQSSPDPPTSSADEATTDLGHLRDRQLMAKYWDDVRLMLERVHGKRTVVVHIEPDLWGYLEQANASALGASFAQRWVSLRNQLAPNVLLAYHMSGWGTKHDIVYEDPPDVTVRAYAAQSATFYKSLHARFDVSFEDFSDRDAGFYEKQQGNAKTWFAPADFRRHLLYGATFVRQAGLRMVAWQIPLGNTFLADTWGRYRDNRVQWLLGAGNRPHLQAYASAGYVGFMFGGGADGTTSAYSDGGYFFTHAKAYVPLKLP